MLLSTHTLEHPSTIAARCSPELSHTLCSLVVHFQQIKRHGLATLPYYHTPSVLSSTNFIRVNRETYVSGGKSPRYRRPLPINKAWGMGLQTYRPIPPVAIHDVKQRGALSCLLLLLCPQTSNSQLPDKGSNSSRSIRWVLRPHLSKLDDQMLYKLIDLV